MKETYDKALYEVLRHEGGYVNHPKDPGGATNKGVTQNTYNSWRRSRGLSARSVRLITDGEVASIYRQNYWNVVRGDELPFGLDFAVFDFGVNSGPSRAVRYLQALVGAAQDGRMGPLTLAAVARYPDTEQLINRYMDRRLAFLRSLGTWPTFGKGWTRRVSEVRAEAIALAQRGRAMNPPAPPQPPVVPTTPAPQPEPTVGFWTALWRLLFPRKDT